MLLSLRIPISRRNCLETGGSCIFSFLLQAPFEPTRYEGIQTHFNLCFENWMERTMQFHDYISNTAVALQWKVVAIRFVKRSRNENTLFFYTDFFKDFFLSSFYFLESRPWMWSNFVISMRMFYSISRFTTIFHHFIKCQDILLNQKNYKVLWIFISICYVQHDTNSFHNGVFHVFHVNRSVNIFLLNRTFFYVTKIC